MEEISKSLGRLESRLLSLNSRYVTRTNLLGNVVRSVATAWRLVSLQRNTRDIVVVEAFLHLPFHLLTQRTSHIFLVAISARWQLFVNICMNIQIFTQLDTVDRLLASIGLLRIDTLN